MSLLLVVGMGIVVIQIQSLIAGDMTLLGIVLAIPLIIAIGSLAAADFAVLAWKNGFWSIGGRVHFSLITVSGLALIWFFSYWNLLGWQY